MNTIKNTGAVALGLVAGAFMNMGIIMINMQFFPLPEGLNWADPASKEVLFPSLPNSSLHRLKCCTLGRVASSRK